MSDDTQPHDNQLPPDEAARDMEAEGAPPPDAPASDEATRVGMPVPPPPQPPAYGGQQPTYIEQPPYGGQPPPPGQPPGQVPYGAPPPYPPPPPPYRTPPRRSSGGPLGILLGLLAVGLLVALAIGTLFVLGLGPFAGPSPSPAGVATATPGVVTPTPDETTPTPDVTPTEPATRSPEPQVTPSPTGPSPSPLDDPVTRLMSHIPAGLRDSCVGQPPAGTASLAIARCTTDDGAIIATYRLFADTLQTQAAYDSFFVQSGIDPDTGTCASEASWPAEGPYSINEQPAGRVLCTSIEGAPNIYWTDEPLNILAHAAGTPGESMRLYEFWRVEAGPMP